ncbi:MAG: prenyltransferase [Rhodocyclaceae bacterium]|nr:prenyltransferase [Rhodocyclaceae bacterium]MBX3669071.1 prenyltransferase [Rhodocyclaceae bacterium]
MSPAEPGPDSYAHPALRFFAATRPAFLSVTVVACLLGTGSAWSDGVAIDPLLALATLAFALCAHAGVNVLNDVHDADADAGNRERIYPYTGGSRFIQNRIIAAPDLEKFGWALFGIVSLAGLLLSFLSGFGLVPIGLVGLFLGWAYSSPPLRLSARGLGELAVAAGWLLIVLGADYVQRGYYDGLALAVGMPFAALVTNLLLVNEFPDWRADAESGKRTLVVRLGRREARWLYLVLSGIAGGWTIAALAAQLIPGACFAALLGLVPSVQAGLVLLRQAEQPQELVPAITGSIVAVLLFGLLLTGGLILGGAG